MTINEGARGGEYTQPPEPEIGEQQPMVQPKIYVASLSDYNDGRLHGEWIDANQTTEDIRTDVGEMLDTSPMPDAEEWAIHDYQGFGAFQPSEYEDIGIVASIARRIATHGPVFAHWANIHGTQNNELLDAFEEYYRGVWPSLASYAESLLEDHGIKSGELGPDWLRPYIHIDYDAFGRDLSATLDTAEDSDGMHIFDTP